MPSPNSGRRLSDRLPNLPPKRDRMTPVRRLRRRARISDTDLVTGRFAPEAGRRSSSTFRIVCWNIEDGIDVDGGVRGLSEHPNLVEADAICLQEMDPVGVEDMARRLEMNYVYSESSKDHHTGRGFGNAVLSPHPLLDPMAMPLPHVAKAYGRPRDAVNATVAWPAVGDQGERTVPVSVWSVHAEIPSLPLSKRIGQYTALAARAIAPNPDHLVVAGDFNTTTLTSVDAIGELYELFDLERASAPGGPSLRRASRLFHLDHIFVRGMETMGTGVEREVIASDHWPMWADLRPQADDPDPEDEA